MSAAAFGSPAPDVLLLPATVTVDQARDTLRMLAQALPKEPAGGVLVDASGLEVFDTSVLAVLLECKRLARASGRGFELRGMPGKLGELSALYGVAGLLSTSV